MPRVDTPFELKVRSILGVNKIVFFIALSLITFLLILIKKQFVIDQIAAIQFMDPAQRLVFNLFKGFELATVPFNLALQFTIVAFVLWVGSFLWGYKVSYNQCWKIAMIASTVFLIPQVLSVLWFTFISTDPSYWEVNAFYPLSVMNFFDQSTLSEKYLFAYKALNVFQIAYWFILIRGIDLAARKRKNIAQAIVFTSYVPLFLLWLWYATATF